MTNELWNKEWAPTCGSHDGIRGFHLWIDRQMSDEAGALHVRLELTDEDDDTIGYVLLDSAELTMIRGCIDEMLRGPIEK